MMNDIKLSIAIPTYNRCELLRQTLDSVMCQVNEYVEVIVSDNASIDGTQEMMKEYCNIHNVSYYRNDENLGMDRNFLTCLQRAKGQYVHLLSDDDILLPGAINKLLYFIEHENPDYINLNSFTYSTDVFNPCDMKPPRIQLDEDLITCDKSLFMGYIGVYITYISATVIKREHFVQLSNPEKYFGTYFLHAHLVFDMLRNNKSKIVVTKDAYLAAKNNNSGGFNLYEVWIKQYKKLLLETAVRNGFDKKLMKRMYVNDVNGFIRDSILKYSVTENTYEMEKRTILFRTTYMYPSVWVKTYKYAILPGRILKRIYYKKRKKGRKSIKS